MSRMYRIAVSESVSRVIHVADGVTTQLEILEVVDKPTMQSLLEAELAKRGFKVEAGKATGKVDGVGVEIDTSTGAVRVSASSEEHVSTTVERSGARDEDWDRGRGRSGSRRADEEALREQARTAGEAHLDAEEKRRRERITAQLEKALPGIQRQLDEVSSAVTREGLKAKARSLGEIEELSESPNGDLTIKVRA